MASPLEYFANNVRTMTTSGNTRELLEYLNRSAELLAENHDILDNVLETLDLEQHTIPILYILEAKLTYFMKNNIADPQPTLKHVAEFVQAIKPNHGRVFLSAFAEMCHLYTNLIVKSTISPVIGIKTIITAIQKSRVNDSQLTPIHADLCLLSLRGKYFKPALTILDIDITAIATTEDNNHDAKYLLLYYYYGGMIYSAVKNYDRALYFYEAAISMPAVAMSHIMLEAYKKYILVSLICEGKLSNAPKYSSQALTRFIKPLSQPYLLLAKAYEILSSDDLASVISSNHEIFSNDTNLGLVNLVSASLYKKKIQRLTQTFLTLSLADVAQKVKLSGPDEAERYILTMVKEGEIFASINKRDGMVLFKDDPEKFNTPGTLERIQNEIIQVIEMNKQIGIMDEEIKLNLSFIKKSINPQEEDLPLQSKSFATELPRKGT